MSHELATKIRVGLEELAIVRQHFETLIAIPSDSTVGVIETSAASAMLHPFYTEIEKILKLIARVGQAESNQQTTRASCRLELWPRVVANGVRDAYR